jgi:eukaryotic-like serine/threonine-protein kinase
MKISATTWNTLSKLLDEALDLEPAARTTWLERLQISDPELASSVQKLLAAHATSETADVLAGLPSIDNLTGASSEQKSQLGLSAGDRVGPYLLKRELGAGGMADVWLAERADGAFARDVALKLPRINRLRKDLAIRFSRERDILARLEHPHIARLYDAGVTSDGLPYLAMEFVDGEPITTYCDNQRMPIKARLELFAQVLDAVQFAHANLIIHRDLKPSNIIVGNDGRVRLLDFGIAKLLVDDESIAETQLTQLSGPALTPDYASPEQIRGEPLSTASDVYSLGVILYELLTGKRPYRLKLATPAQLEQAIIDSDPTPPSARILQEASKEDRREARRRAKVLEGDLDTIIMKSLQKKTSLRYATATELALELKRHLAFEPIHAKRESGWYSFKKFVRRNRFPVAGTVTLLVSLSAGLVGTLWQASLAKTAAIEAQKQRDLSTKALKNAQALNELNIYLLNDASPASKPLSIAEMMERAEQVIDLQYKDNPEIRISLMLTIGHEYQAMGQYTKARTILSDAYERAKTVEDTALRARAGCVWGYTRSVLGEIKEGKALIEEGQRLLEISPNEDQEIGCLISAARFERRSGDAQNALHMFEQAVSRSNAQPNASKVANAKLLIDLAQSLAAVARYRDSLNKSQEAYQQLVALGRGATFAAGVALNGWAGTLEAMGRPIEARQIHLKDLALGRASQGQEVSQYENSINIARTQLALHEFSEAASTAALAREAAVRSGNKYAQHRAGLAMAHAFCEMGEFDKAAGLVADAESWMNTGLARGHFLFRYIATYQGMIAMQRGETDLALDYFAKAVDEEKLASQKSLYHTYSIVKRSDAYLALGQPQRAATEAAVGINHAIGIINGVGKSAYAGEAYLALGRALRVLGKVEDARIAFQNAHEHLSETMGTYHRLTAIAEIEKQK